ncbi:MAG: type II secretion system protein [Phycisphaerae bacterium]
MMPSPNSNKTIDRAWPAFTLIELLVVIAVIAILLGIVLGVGTGVLDDAKARDTQNLLSTLKLAVDTFSDEAPLTKIGGYNSRYVMNAPPDELEAISNAADFSAPVFNTIMSPASEFIRDLNGANVALGSADDTLKAQGDVIAMVLTIKQYSASAAGILDKVDRRFVRSMVDVPNAAAKYFDRDGTKTFVEPLIYYVDSWGTPVEYFSVCAPGATPTLANFTEINNNWRVQTATALVHKNGGAPLLASYGPDGPDQFAADFANPSSDRPFDLFEDWMNYPTSGPPRLIDHPLNADNLYSNPDFAGKLADANVS